MIRSCRVGRSLNRLVGVLALAPNAIVKGVYRRRQDKAAGGTDKAA